MTYEFEYLLSLVGVAALGNSLQPLRQSVSWKKIFDKASEQTVYALAAYAAKPFWTLMDADLRNSIRIYLYSTVAYENERLKAILKLLLRFSEKNIPFALLKGCSLAALYKVPELRESADTDIYVGKKFEKSAIDLLKKEGVSIKKRVPSQHESIAWHNAIGTIELHAFLFREEDRKAWFGRSKMFSEEISGFCDQKIANNENRSVLNHQTNAEFLCLHFIKHFIREGIGIRNILDIGVFFYAYADAIDYAKLWKLLESLNYDTVIQAVLNVCVKYFKMDASRFAGYKMLSNDVVESFLNDVETGGYLGRNDINRRKDSTKQYETYLYSQRNAGERLVIWKMRRHFWERVYAAFYDKEKLKTLFPYAKKHKSLLPVAWIHFLVVSVSKQIARYAEKDKEVREMPSNPCGRTEVFRKLNIIK